MRKLGARAWILLVFVSAMFAVACNALLDFGQFEVGALDGGGSQTDVVTSDSDVSEGGSSGVNDAGADDGGCIDPAGFGGRGCYRCKPTNQEQLLRACTKAKFESFDNATRIKDFDASDPRPAIVNGGPLPPNFDAGATTSSSSGGTADAGDCPLDDAVNYPNPVMVYGATGLPMDTIARAMVPEATIYYLPADSCQGVGAAVLQQPKMTGKVTYYDQTGGAHTCQLDEDPDQNADIAISGLFPESCSGVEVSPGQTLPAGTQLPSDWKDFGGAVNPAMFAVPPSSAEKIISAEAAYRVYAFGSGTAPLAKSVVPWIDENFIFRRTQTSGTQQTIARDLGLPFDALRGVNAGGSGNMKKAMIYVSTSAPDKVNNTLGISTSEIVDADRANIRSLAYQHYGMPVGFYPDSDANLFDRRNVRDGHYPLWLSLHVFARLNGNGDPIAATNVNLQTRIGKTKPQRDAAVRRLVDVLANRAAAPKTNVDLFGAYKLLGDVPTCAMTVTRTSEGSDLVPFTPPVSCGCAFEAANPGSAPPECVTCSASQPCTGSSRTTCSFGYCE
jgi:hypothetical protein